MWRKFGRWTSLALFNLLNFGCAGPPYLDEPLPLVADVFFVDRPHSVTWASRSEVLICRHQWDVMPVALRQHVVLGQRVDRPIQLELVVGGEGVGYAHDWVLLRITPPLGMIGEVAPIDRAFVPKPDDHVVVMTRYGGTSSPNPGAAKVAVGQIRSVEFARPLTSGLHADGDLIHVELDHGRFVPGWSGSPAFVWDEAHRRWAFLGIAVATDFAGKVGSSLSPDGRNATIVRPPDWVFDLLTPDEPTVTWPGEAP